MISTRNLSHLPDINTLHRLTQSLAMLDAILSPDWQYRYFSFDSRWSPGERMASMRNGQGDHFFALFTSAGCWLKGFDHESPISPFAQTPPRIAPGVLDNIPKQFAPCLTEPAFLPEETTFCIWRLHTDTRWHHGPIQLPNAHPDPDGSQHLLHLLDAHPETYRHWAQDYYETPIPHPAIQSIYVHQPLTPQLVADLNPNASLKTLANDIQAIAYPSGQR